MNEDKLKEFVTALDALSDDIKDWDVDMNSDVKPMCDTPGCHAGLISIVAKDLPELQEIYERIFFSHWNLKYSHYEYSIWADALAEFLGFENRRGLAFWAENNPKLWGNKFGGDMFVFEIAFIDDTKAYIDDLAKQLTHRDIINYWKQVLTNIEKGDRHEQR
ncbi:hypothetical protein [uncultured Gammaproteobacteria bacterium]|nr:hypothetical protein [uncultured Gammaproteobacteria bacterium]